MLLRAFRSVALLACATSALVGCGGGTPQAAGPMAVPTASTDGPTARALAATTASPTPTGLIGQSYTWSLIFQDEFDGSAVDTSKWARCIYWGITANGCYQNLSQLEWYLPANGSVANGLLTLQARKQRIKTSKGTFNYTSGFIDSDRDTNTTATQAKFDFQYGYVEVRARVPAGKGLWPAFWMLPSDHSTSHEIDIMEILGDRPDKTYMTLHYGSQSVGSSWAVLNTDFSKGFHTYAVDWTPDYIAWYIDGVEQYRVTDQSILPNKRFFLIANLQVGGSWPGSPDASTVFPANYDIDYIRVWKKGDAIPVVLPPLATNLLQNPSFESGTTPWSLDVKTGAAATLAQDAGAATDGAFSGVVNTTLSSSTDWYVQLVQGNVATTAGQTYTIDFMAKAETPRTVALVVQMNDSPYTETFRQNVALTTNWTRYRYSYTAPATYGNNKLSFSLAANTGKVWLDQVGFGY